jgi:hypothetical protein
VKSEGENIRSFFHHIKYFPNFAAVPPKCGTKRDYQLKILNLKELEPKKNLFINT